ncbi:MAG TPA: PilZ domain-containing protein, partial [Gemmataceae bacterium]|nr:PilZ domain-containing protein [Gemmataceae bacterium]
FFDSFNPFIWGTGVPVAIGLVAALSTLFMGRLVMRKIAPTAEFPAQSDPKDSVPLTFKSTEMRAATRRGGNAVAVFIADPQRSDEPRRGWVVDRSAGGLCIALDNPVEAGTVLRIRVCNAPVTVPWAEVEVKSCRKDGNQWEAGCKFVVIPSYNVLMLFG